MVVDVVMLRKYQRGRRQEWTSRFLAVALMEIMILDEKYIYIKGGKVIFSF